MTDLNIRYTDAALRSAEGDLNSLLSYVEGGNSFLVEGPGGTGKSETFARLALRLHGKYHTSSLHERPSIACITHQPNELEALRSRLENERTVMVSNIQAFAWYNLKNLQNALIETIKSAPDYFTRRLRDLATSKVPIREVVFTNGVAGYYQETVFLSLYEVIKVFIYFMDNCPKFLQLFKSRWKVILIDEYQDLDKDLIPCLIHHFIESGNEISSRRLILGFFGDSWQTINNKFAHGELKNSQLRVINKRFNFRSPQPLVNFINLINTDTVQISAIRDAATDDNSKDNVIITFNKEFCRSLEDEIKHYQDLRDTLHKDYPEREYTTLMLTHYQLAYHQHYEAVQDVFKGNMLDSNEPHPLLLYLRDTLIPVTQALKHHNYLALHDALRHQGALIKCRQDKYNWRDLSDSIQNSLSGTLQDVLKVLIDKQLIPIAQEVYELYQAGISRQSYAAQSALMISYEQYLNYIKANDPQNPYSTEHGSKGKSFNSVFLPIQGGSSSSEFNYVHYLAYLNDPEVLKQLSSEEAAKVIKNRNLLYLCLSRAEQGIAIHINVPRDSYPKFKSYIQKLTPCARLLSYQDFMQSRTAEEGDDNNNYSGATHED